MKNAYNFIIFINIENNNSSLWIKSLTPETKNIPTPRGKVEITDKKIIIKAKDTVILRALSNSILRLLGTLEELENFL